MQNLTKDNFNEFIADEAIVTFASKNGCKFCTEFKPIYTKFAEDTPSAKCGLYEREQLMQDPDEIEKKYGINSFPTILHFKDGKVLGKLETYMFMEDQALAGYILDQEIEYAKRKKALFDMTVRIEKMKAHISMKPALPQDTQGAEKTDVPQSPLSPPVDLSGFPVGQSPEGGGCEGCGDSEQ